MGRLGESLVGWSLLQLAVTKREVSGILRHRVQKHKRNALRHSCKYRSHAGSRSLLLSPNEMLSMEADSEITLRSTACPPPARNTYEAGSGLIENQKTSMRQSSSTESHPAHDRGKCNSPLTAICSLELHPNLPSLLSPLRS